MPTYDRGASYAVPSTVLRSVRAAYSISGTGGADVSSRESVSLKSGYSVNVTYDPIDWFYADTTQRISNKLPSHSTIRKLKHSVGQTFLNAVAGAHLDEFEKDLEGTVRNSYTITHSLDAPDVIKTVDIPGWVDVDEPTLRANFLKNSGFEIHTVPSFLPDYWRKQGTISVSSGLEGRNALQLTTWSLGTTSVYQEMELRIPKNESWTASTWYKVSTNALTAPSTDYGLKITATHNDGTATTNHGIFSATTSGAWRYKTLTVSYSKETTKLTFEVIVKDTAAFAFSGNTLDIDCAQFERGTKAAPWRPDVLDTLPYTENESKSSILLTGGNYASYVDNMDDFWYRSVPTRSSYVSTTAGTYATSPTTGSVDITDFSKKTWKFLFESIGTAIRKRGIDVPGDISRDYVLAVRDYAGEYKPLVGTKIEVLTFFGNRLWALVKELDQNEAEIRTLHVLEHRMKHPEPTYLESIAAVKVPSNVPLSSLVVRLEFKSEDRQHIYLSTTTAQYALRLHYDVFTYDADDRVAFFREDYTQISVV
jgi:hypothetical protein